MTNLHDAFVAARFDASEARFKDEVASDDIRLRAVLSALGPLDGRRVLDLGCGKGRFAAHLKAAGAEVVGLDVSSAMLARAKGLDRVRASARRLPFAGATFDAVVAVEVLEHVGDVAPVLREARRVLRAGGRIVVVDKNAFALDDRRPWLPSLAVKWIDERRGLWMYPSGGPVRERWFGPLALKSRLGRDFEDARVEFLLRPEEAGRAVFRRLPAARLMTLWTARVPGTPLDVLASPQRDGERGGPPPPQGPGGDQGGWPGRTAIPLDGVMPASRRLPRRVRGTTMIDGLGKAPLPLLPLMLWETPPGLELALAQEGVPFVRVRDPHPLAFEGGRFVLYDGKKVPAGLVRSTLSGGHSAIDVDAFRRGEPVDPFRALVDTEAAPGTWSAEGLTLVERVARYPKARVRRRLIGRLRSTIAEAGGIWARLGAYPFPYRSAFNLRVDLDEPEPEDYARFARARRPIDDCTTHFVSTGAYGGLPQVLDDLRGGDVQSHGHYHFVYREPSANRRNLERAHAILVETGFAPEGFAGPHGRWNPGIDQVLEDLGYSYSSDFQLGYDDIPSFPWRGDRFSRVLQVPVHPLSEGVFLEAGGGWRSVADHLVRAVRAKVEAGEPAFVYGHPEGRLGRYPGIVSAVAEAVARESMLWRTTLTEFARWWRWRAARSWSVVAREGDGFDVQFDEWDAGYPMALEVVRARHAATIPLSRPEDAVLARALAYERRDARVDLPEPEFRRRPRGIKAAVRSALDWETVTPVEELPTGDDRGPGEAGIEALERAMRQGRAAKASENGSTTSFRSR